MQGLWNLVAAALAAFILGLATHSAWLHTYRKIREKVRQWRR